ncbi:hypothetical protein C8T65DRAFT_699741 [Cerioporus squamosus]|nr:hypothetical protein C8T65DRAFT_699741 [Cerioporus squamosus]
MPTDNSNKQSCPHISGSEVAPFAQRFQGVIRELYLPGQVSKWKQLVRAGVLIVGLVKGLREESRVDNEQLQEIIHDSRDVSVANWISEWLDLQPPTRFLCPKAFVKHPLMLLYPSDTAPYQWLPFWTRCTQVIFRTLLGLRGCSRESKNRAAEYMDLDEWEAWADDVQWVFGRLLDLAKLHGKSVFGVPPHLAYAGQALRRAPFRSAQQESLTFASGSQKRRSDDVEYGGTKRQKTTTAHLEGTGTTLGQKLTEATGREERTVVGEAENRSRDEDGQSGHVYDDKEGEEGTTEGDREEPITGSDE